MEKISELELAKLQIAEMEKEIHYLRMRVKALSENDSIEEEPSVIGDGSYGHLDI